MRVRSTVPPFIEPTKEKARCGKEKEKPLNRVSPFWKRMSVLRIPTVIDPDRIARKQLRILVESTDSIRPDRVSPAIRRT
jgi:hypothetical protein